MAWSGQSLSYRAVGNVCAGQVAQALQELAHDLAAGKSERALEHRLQLRRHRRQRRRPRIRRPSHQPSALRYRARAARACAGAVDWGALGRIGRTYGIAFTISLLEPASSSMVDWERKRTAITA